MRRCQKRSHCNKPFQASHWQTCSALVSAGLPHAPVQGPSICQVKVIRAPCSNDWWGNATYRQQSVQCTQYARVPKKQKYRLGVFRRTQRVSFGFRRAAIQCLRIGRSTARTYRRIRFILGFAYTTGLRLHEMVQARVGDLKRVSGTDGDQWWMDVIGKGKKHREVPIPPFLLDAINDHLRERKSSVGSVTPQGIRPLLANFADSR
jgi:integrase